MQKSEPARVISEARGFLTALRCLSSSGTIAWIGIMPIKNGRDQTIDSWIEKDPECIYGDRCVIDRITVRKFIRENFLNRIPSSAKQMEELEWQLNEYIDLAGDADSGIVEFGRLRRDDIILINVAHSDFKLHGALVITLENHIVVLTLGDCDE